MPRAILSRFIRSFDGDGPHADKEFWERMVHEEHGSGTYWLGGWMSAFCAWDSKGIFFADSEEDSGHSHRPSWVRSLEVDGHRISRVRACPEGYAEVDVKVTDESEKAGDCRMLGHIGISLAGDQLGTIRIAPQWVVYAKGEAAHTRQS